MANMKQKKQSRLSGENAAIVASARQAVKEPEKSKAVQKKGKSPDDLAITDPKRLKSGENPFDATIKKLKKQDTEDFSKSKDNGRG